MTFCTHSNCYANYERGHPGVAKTMPVIWCREVGGDPRGTTFSKPYIESTASGNHQPATELAYSPHRLDLGHNLPASKIDNATLPGQITSGNDSDTRQMLFQFAGKLTEYFQRNLRISVKQSGNSENDGGDAPGPSINALVDQYACKMKQNRMEGVVIQSQALDELASRCAWIMDQCSRETPMGTARSKTADAETAHAEIAHPETAHTEIGSGDTGTNNTVDKRSKAPAKGLRGCKPPYERRFQGEDQGQNIEALGGTKGTPGLGNQTGAGIFGAEGGACKDGAMSHGRFEDTY